MQRKSGQRDSEPDVEAALNELYTTPPPDLVRRREVLASAAKSAGRVEDARRIHAAKKQYAARSTRPRPPSNGAAEEFSANGSSNSS
jgi:hypothetical protein